MKKLIVLLAVLAGVRFAGDAHAADSAKVYNGTDPVETNLILPTDGGSCDVLSMNTDGSYENGYAWQYAGVVAPTYGAFAECYIATFYFEKVCALVFDLTQVGNQAGQQMDLYVWDDVGGVPGNVICGPVPVTPGSIAFWPSLSRHVFEVPDPCCVQGLLWVGYWGNWPGQLAPWYVGADLDGFGGCPLTNIAPGIGYPTGWTNTSQVWGPTQALGIGYEAVNCESVPVQRSTWGTIKNLYN